MGQRPARHVTRLWGAASRWRCGRDRFIVRPGDKLNQTARGGNVSDRPVQPSPRIVYASQYNIGFLGLERLHPFDSRKYGRAWGQLRKRYGDRLRRFHVRPERPVNHEELLEVHTAAYLRRLNDPAFVANVLELPPLRRLPHWAIDWFGAIDWFVLRRMRWATMGTILAAREALEHGLAINLAGGYHHASPDDGHGFCAYADVGLAVDRLRTSGALGEEDKVIYVDLDAHQGNGVCRTFYDDLRVFISTSTTGTSSRTTSMHSGGSIAMYRCPTTAPKPTISPPCEANCHRSLTP